MVMRNDMPGDRECDHNGKYSQENGTLHNVANEREQEGERDVLAGFRVGPSGWSA